jgi:hypothetical protein
MSRIPARSLALATGVALAGLATAPAFATTTARPTSLTLRAQKSTVAPNTKDTLIGFLKTGKTPVKEQPVQLEKRAAGAKSFTLVGTQHTDQYGRLLLSVKPGKVKGQKEQYELVYQGEKGVYGASHSQIITVTVS